MNETPAGESKSYYLPVEMVAAVAAEAERQRRSASQIVQFAIEEYLARCASQREAARSTRAK